MRVADWVFAFALPTSERQFRYARAVGEYCHEYNGWNDYAQLVLAHFKKYIVPFKSVGLTIVAAPSSRRFARLLTGNRGIVLFGHCNHRRSLIEFSDGMTTYESTIACVRREFQGVVDLSVCNPTGFDHLLKLRAPECAVKITWAELDPEDWFRFYGYLFSEFESGERSYAEAIQNTCSRFNIGT
jgi:hypothetical protein